MLFPKQKRIRITGEALAKLNKEIHDRDDNACIICRRFVLPGEKFHHQPFGSSNKSDRVECGCVLCFSCHHQLHFGASSILYQQRCEEYLTNLYPEYWASRQ